MFLITKPMLAGKLTDLKAIRYPVYATPKLDGIRCLKIKGKAVSRTFKPIANVHSRETIEKYFPDGVDGELMVDQAAFHDTSSAVMSEDGKPAVVYFIFDYVKDSIYDPYLKRMLDLKNLGKELETRIENRPPYNLYKMILPVRINNEEELVAFEVKCLADGYEGIMLRTPASPYKCGRSSEKEGYLLKMKRFSDTEAEIIGYEEKMHNANPATKDAFGRTERSTHQENQVPTNSLGAMVVKSKEFKSQYKVGSGFTEEQRVELWKVRKDLVGKYIKVKYQPTGVLDVPRFPTFIGFRDKRDM